MYDNFFSHECKQYLLSELTDEYVQKTAQLINKEWPRSQCQRVMSLKQNVRSDKLKIPISLILIDTESDRVVGHVSLASITAADDLNRNLILVQTVVVDPEYRGKQLGKIIMLEAEIYVAEYAKIEQNGLAKIDCGFFYLNTKDKQLFYEKLGYIRIEPILFYANKQSKFNFNMKNLLQSLNKEKQIEKGIFSSECSMTNFSAAPPPPPLPVSTNLSCQSKSTCENFQVTWFKKKII